MQIINRLKWTFSWPSLRSLRTRTRGSARDRKVMKIIAFPKDCLSQSKLEACREHRTKVETSPKEVKGNKKKFCKLLVMSVCCFCETVC